MLENSFSRFVRLDNISQRWLLHYHESRRVMEMMKSKGKARDRFGFRPPDHQRRRLQISHNLHFAGLFVSQYEWETNHRGEGKLLNETFLVAIRCFFVEHPCFIKHFIKEALMDIGELIFRQKKRCIKNTHTHPIYFVSHTWSLFSVLSDLCWNACVCVFFLTFRRHDN